MDIYKCPKFISLFTFWNQISSFFKIPIIKKKIEKYYNNYIHNKNKMAQTLIIGKIYNLNFNDPDENADVEDYLESIAKMSGIYKLIGEGMIPWGDEDISKCEKFKYYLFKKNIDEIIEVFIDQDKEYSTLVFYNSYEKKVSNANYSTYLDYGSEEFVEFYRPGIDIKVNIELSKKQEW